MKKIVSALLLSLVASQASAQISDLSIQANLEQCLALTQHSMSNEEILATVQTALDQAAHTDSFDIKVKTSGNKKVIWYVIGGVVVVGVVGTGIDYYLKKSEKNPKKPTNESGRSENTNQEEDRESQDLKKDHERDQKIRADLAKKIASAAAEAKRQASYEAFDADLAKDWAQAEFDAASIKATTDHERENSERAQREAALERKQAELARAQRVLKTMLELDRVAREKEAHEREQH